MGMDLIVIPKANAKGLDKANFGIEIRLAHKVSDVYQTFFN
jgi:DNA repair protein RadA/Sms